MNIKKKFQVLILVLTQLNFTVQQCQEGCLKCNTDDKCEICDTTSFYSLKAQTCEKIDQPNCFEINLKGQCLSCFAGFYIDENTLKCVQIEAGKEIENCKNYYDPKTCLNCNTGFFLSSKCEAVELEIKDCDIYKNATHCLICLTGKMLSFDKTTCNDLAVIPNCNSYNSISCRTCEAGTLKNYNNYIYDLNSTVNTGEMTLIPLLIEKSFNYFYFPNVCKPIEVLFCENYVSFKECKICQYGYYLQDGICIQYPLEIIPNCDRYESFVKCYRCQSEFHLNSSSHCVANEKIDNCSEYDPSAKITTCLMCQDDYFLLSQTSCKKRSVLEIKNCNSLSKTVEKCEKCSDSYTNTDDGLACLPMVLKCINYNSSTKDSSALVCNGCENNYYLSSDKKCLPGIVQNCEGYSGEICIKCKNRYYLENSLCVQHNEIVSCDVYSPTKKDTCANCNSMTLMFAVNNICKEAGKINGCLVFSSSTTCSQCKEGYYLVGSTCTAISESLNCLVYDSQTTFCTKCMPNYILDKNKCLLILNFIGENCFKNNLDNGTTNLVNTTCESCKDYAIFFPTEEYVCVLKSWITQLTNTFIDGCDKYFQSSLGVTSCQKCQWGKYLKSTTECGDCEQAVLLTKISKVSSIYSFDDLSFSCLTYASTSMVNCKYWISPNVDSGTYLPVCLSCKQSFNVIDPTSTKSIPISSYVPSDNYGYPTTPIGFFPVVTSCDDKDNSKIFPGLGPVANCEYYQNIPATDNIGCIKCIHGYTGKLKNIGTKAFIVSCEVLPCGKTFTPGLQPQLNSYVSCHNCATGKLPVLFVDAGNTYSDIKGFFSYQLDSITTVWTDIAKTGGQLGQSMGCYSKAELATLTTIPIINVSENCGILMMNVESDGISAENSNLSTGVDLSKIAIMCVACQKGFYRTFAKDSTNATVKFMVSACTIIDNCNSSSWMNYCSDCKKGYAHLWTETGVDYTSCIQVNNDTNCYAGKLNECKICNKGYTFNLDGYCEMLMAPKCLFSGVRLIGAAQEFINTQYFLSPQGEGCIDCEESYYSLSKLNQKFPSKICWKSDYSKAQVFDVAKGNYIKDCEKYYLSSSKMLCKKCNISTILSINEATCYPIATLPNCDLASSTTYCVQCINTHISVSGVCQLKAIDNCLIYILDSTLTQQKCQLCQPSYYIKNFICEKGIVTNCDVFSSDPNICITCADGYELIKDAQNNSYCFPHDPNMNCDLFDSNKFSQQILECTKCKTTATTNYYISTNTLDFKTSTCSKLTDVPNCTLKNKDSSFSNSTFRCQICNDGYYSLFGSCELRTNSDSNCEAYYNDEDKCLTCKDGYFLSDSKIECLPFPNGIIGCRVYTSATKCVACLENYYQVGDNCIMVEELSRIQNCLYYANATTCKQCKENFFLESNVCQIVKALNCKTVLSVNKCDSCTPDRGLKDESDKTNCVKPDDIKCVRFSLKYPFECYECDKGYYIGADKRCQIVESSTENCIVYEDKETCKKCRKNYVLDVSKKQCSNFSFLPIDPKCDDLFQDSKLNCAVCNGGFYMDADGACIACKAANCYFCNPLDDKVCLMCNSGSYMTKDGSCVSTTVPVDVIPTDTKFTLLKNIAIFIIHLLLI